MTRRDLEQLRSLKNEVRHLQEELQNLPMTKDSVRGSMIEYPCIERTMVISGIDEGAAIKLRRKLERKCAELQEKIDEMENWLDTISDSETRNILRLRYRNGLSWQRIALEIGRAGDGSTERKRCEKLFDIQDVSRKS